MNTPIPDTLPVFHHHLGEGLEGHRLLPFMAALGCLVVASHHLPEQNLRLGWQNGLYWRPIWTLNQAWTRTQLVEQLLLGLKTRLNAPELAFADDLTVSPEHFRALLLTLELEAQPHQRQHVDLAAALGSELYPGEKAIQDTAFRTMSGAGHQHFLKTIRELLAVVEHSHLEKTLFMPWRYSDERLSMRWDAADDRRHALRAQDPSSTPPRTEWGANALAALSLSCFPSVITGTTLKTVGFNGRHFRWPLWKTPLSLPVIRSLLNHPALWSLDDLALSTLGVVQVMECDRLSVDKFRSFSPARSVWRAT